MSSDRPVAIIDIGSNSVRLVVYSNAGRAPAILFNEKVMAGLGRELAKTGELAPEAQESALAALRRFRILIDQMAARTCRVVATAAVRDAANGAAFLKSVRATGFSAEILSGKEEAFAAGLGVASAFPDADGIVGDLGGGSLELVDIAGGKIRDGVSLPLGVLRLQPLLDKSPAALARRVREELDDHPVLKRAADRPIYMVGGSWRAVARLDMLLRDHSLPITHHYRMRPDRPAEIQQALNAIGTAKLKKHAALSTSRMPTLPSANLLLIHLVKALRPRELIVSSYGIREGLLYDALDARTRALDPLIEAARAAGRGFGRFAEHGALIDRWIDPAFDDPPSDARLRLAACLLSDVAWSANPDFRAERGMDIALHGNWVGIDIPGRVMLAQALFANFGGGLDFGELAFARLCSSEKLRRAWQWGLAMRLAHRLSGGVAESLEQSRLRVRRGKLRLEVPERHEAILGEPVLRRLKTLATSLDLESEAAGV